MIPALMCLLFLLNGLSDAFRNSAVADEVGGHMACGYLYWHCGEYSGGIANFPLPHLLIALPVVALGYSYELFTEQHLILFRLPVLLLGLLAGVTVYRFAAELYGRRPALIALALFSLSPNILAHASLATLDFPIAFFVLLTVYALWCYVQRPHWARMFALSAALACALTTKVQALLLVPLVLVVLAVSFGGRLWHREKRLALLGPWLLLPVVPWVFINLVYLHVPAFPGDLLPAPFLEALERKLAHATGAAVPLQVAYLMGAYSAEGWWYYFPLAVMLKTPLPTLALAALGLARQPTRRCLLFVILPIAVFLGAAMATSLNIGLRHVLIIYPFLFMLAGKGAERLWTRSWRGLVLALLGAGYLWQAVLIGSHHLCYFNVLTGGSRHGHRCLIGSNYDWGQNDHFLRRYVNRRGLPYQINPGPFRPTTGRILVNANALHGLYGGGGPTAYAWLERFEPVGQIAYTWFEYHIPAGTQFDPQSLAEQLRQAGRKHPFRPWNVQNVEPAKFDAALQQIERHLLELRNRYTDLGDRRFRLALAEAFVATAAYDCALEEARRLLAQDPGFARALGLGSELMVCWKAGVLRFEGDEYLSGFRVEPISERASLPDVAAAAELVGSSPRLAHVHRTLGIVLDQLGRTDGAIEHYRAAMQMTPPAPAPPDRP